VGLVEPEMLLPKPDEVEPEMPLELDVALEP
jgi:hypothetical protein